MVHKSVTTSASAQATDSFITSAEQSCIEVGEECQARPAFSWKYYLLCEMLKVLLYEMHVQSDSKSSVERDTDAFF